MFYHFGRISTQCYLIPCILVISGALFPNFRKFSLLNLFMLHMYISRTGVMLTCIWRIIFFRRLSKRTSVKKISLNFDSWEKLSLVAIRSFNVAAHLWNFAKISNISTWVIKNSSNYYISVKKESLLCCSLMTILLKKKIWGKILSDGLWLSGLALTDVYNCGSYNAFLMRKIYLIQFWKKVQGRSWIKKRADLSE